MSPADVQFIGVEPAHNMRDLAIARTAHYANVRILDSLADSLNIPTAKMPVNIHKYGNTSAASVPILLHESLQEGRIKRGDLCLLAAFGTGFNWGASLLRW